MEKKYGIIAGHRQYESPMEFTFCMKIKKGESRSQLSFDKVEELKDKLVIGAYVYRQIEGDKPMTDKEGCPLLSTAALNNTFITLKDSARCPIVDGSRLLHWAIDPTDACCIGKYKQILMPNFVSMQNSFISIDTSCLVEDEESLCITFVYMDDVVCTNLEKCGTMARLF